MQPESVIHSHITLAGQRFAVSRDARGQRFIGDQTVEAFMETMSLRGKKDILDDLEQIGRATVAGTLVLGCPQQTAFALHQARARNN